VRLFGDFAVGQIDQLLATSAHADGDVAQRGSFEAEARRLMMARAAEAAKFPGHGLLELFDKGR